jgi:hypothetical protein
MRYAVLLGSLLSFCAWPAAAEERQFGVRLGPSASVVTFEPATHGDYGRRIAAGGGGFVVLPVRGRLALQLEALISPRGAKLYEPEEDMTGTVILTYVDVPVLLRVNGPAFGDRSLHLFAGPYAGIRAGATRQVAASHRGITSGIRTDMRDETERFEAGLTMGAGLEVGPRFVLDGRYSAGLTPLNRDRRDGFRIRNRALSFTAGLRF